LGAFNLADVIILRKGDLTKAEDLARESLRIRSLIYSSDHFNIGNCCGQLARILRQQGHFGDETRGFYERALAIAIENEGIDGRNVAPSSVNIASFFYECAMVQSSSVLKRKQQLLGKSHYENGYRIYSKLYGANHPDTKLIASQMADASRAVSVLTACRT
jgi:tetratricopeptide (TPR) repeat protein